MTESVQWTLIIPVVLLTLLSAIQVATWAHGRHTIRQAAAAGAEAAAFSPEGSGGAEARRVAASVAESGGLHSVSVQVSVTPGEVDVVATGRVDLIVDLGLGTVTAQAQAPRERVS